jgi:hypothetical protein
MAVELRRKGKRIVWKPCLNRLVPEFAFQQMVAALPGSGLSPVVIRPAWEGIETDFIEPRERKEEDLDQRCRGLAHLLLLIGCFGLSDLHSENILWDGQGLVVVDAETFSLVGGWHPEALSEEQTIMNRISDSIADYLLVGEGQPAVVARGVLRYLDEATARLRSHWPRLEQIRKAASGGYARIIRRNTSAFTRLLPYALDPEWEGAVLEELRRSTHSIREDPEATLGACKQGAFPRIEEIIPESGWSEPERVAQCIRSWLGMGQEVLQLSVSGEKIEGLEQLVHTSRILVPGNPSFITTDKLGFDFPSVNTVNSFTGLIGVSLLQWAKQSCGVPLDLSCRCLGEVDAALIVGARSVNSAHLGVGNGYGGLLLYAWARKEMGCAFKELEDLLRNQIFLNKDFQLLGARDLFTDASGLCFGAARFVGRLPVEGLLILGLRRMEEEAADLIRFMEEGTTLDNYGVAHGIAGLALSIHATSTALGVTSQVLPALGKWIRNLLSSGESLNPEHDLCRGRAGMLAVLARILPDLASDFPWPESTGTLRRFGRPRGEGLCHGNAATAAAFGFWPEETELSDDPMDRLSGFGLIGGYPGAAYGRLAWKARLPNILWGGRMGDENPAP